MKWTWKTRATILAWGAALWFLATADLPAQAESARLRRPNILWIVGENFKLDFGCYGAQHVSTPNLDALAAGGLRYTRVFPPHRSARPAVVHS